MRVTPFERPLDERDWEADADGTVRWALVGLGWWTSDFALPAIEESEYGVATVAVSSSTEKAEGFAEEHGLAAGITYEEFHDGVAADEYDAAYVGTPNALHREHVEAAAGHGKHALVEKPMEASVERAEAMVEACADAGVELMVGYRMQCDHLLRRTRELIEAGVVGDVVQVDGACAGPFVSADGKQGWRTDPELAGGGAMYDIGVYPLNTLRFLLGADPESVVATLDLNDGFMNGMDRHASFDLAFPGGVTASCRTSYDAAFEDYLVVLGTEGRLFLDDAFGIAYDRTLRIQGPEEHGDVVEVTAGGDELVEEFDYFANHVLSGRTVGPDGEHGLVDMQVLEAVYESHESGRRVDL